MEKVQANEIDFSQGFSIKVVSRSCSLFNSLPASSDFCHLLITFANSLDPDQARLNIGPDLDRTVWHPNGIEKNPTIKELNMAQGIIKAIFENPKADQNTLFRRYAIFETHRVYFYSMTYICSHSTFLVANDFNG